MKLPGSWSAKWFYFKPKIPPNKFLAMEVKSLFSFKLATDFHAQIFETDPYILCVGQFSAGASQQIAALKPMVLRMCD